MVVDLELGAEEVLVVVGVEEGAVEPWGVMGLALRVGLGVALSVGQPEFP